MADVLDDYRAQFVAGTHRQDLREEQTELVVRASVPDPVTSYGDVVSFAAADALWIQTYSLSANLGPGNPGSQLDCRKGTRAFFGFTAGDVLPNTTFGSVYIQASGHQPTERTLRFGDNQMDKINLPLPGIDGPATYDNAFLLFERSGYYGDVPLFRLSVLDEEGLRRRRDVVRRVLDFELHGGRQYGLLFY